MTTLRLDLKADLTLDAWKRSLRRFFAWWGGCLWEMTPSSWRARLIATFGRWTVRLDGECWSLRAPASEHDDLLLDPALPDEELRGRIASIAPASRERRVQVVIPAQSGLIRQLRLPEAAGQRLRSVVGLQLERLSPFRAEDVRFDCRVVDGDADGEILAEVAIVPTRILRESERHLHRLGLGARWILLQDLPYRFAAVGERRALHERLNRVLGAIALTACVLAIVLAPMLRAAELGSLSDDVRGLRAPAHRSAELVEDLRRIEVPLRATDRALAGPQALDILERLSALLPADVQLSDLKIDGANVRLSGYCGDAGRLIALLRHADGFTRVATGAPGGRAADGRDRFEIEMLALAPGARR